MMKRENSKVPEWIEKIDNIIKEVNMKRTVKSPKIANETSKD